MHLTVSGNSIYILFVSLLLCACRQKSEMLLPFYNDPNFTPLFLQNNTEIQDQVTHTIQNFSCINQDSILITQQDIEGKIHVANFFFTSCGSICPIMTDNMKMVSHAFSSDSNVVLLSYSVTPWIDRVEQLKQYAELKQIDDPNWHLLTGNQSEIYTLARQSYFAEETIGFTKDSTEFLHTEHFILVDQQKRIRGIYNGTLELEVNHLMDDIYLLQRELF